MGGDERAHGCFLCEPDQELVFLRGEDSIALSGLGPIVPHYGVVASRAHIPSAADAQRAGLNIAATARRLVEAFNARDMRCVVAEHGRVPVCAERIGQERHCYHAHLLVFPGAKLPDMDVTAIFGSTNTYPTFDEALRHAPVDGEYYLLSDNLEETIVHTVPHGVPRQFLRALIAANEGRPELADWRAYPDQEIALKYAAELRKLFGTDQ